MSLGPQFFHVSPSDNRQSIERHGLDTRRGRPQWEESDPEHGAFPGNYLFHDIHDARTHARNLASIGEDGFDNYRGAATKFDIYEVTVPKHVAPKLLGEDPILERSSRTTTPIPRSWVRRRESLGHVDG